MLGIDPSRKMEGSRMGERVVRIAVETSLLALTVKNLPAVWKWRRKWQLTPVFLPGESRGLGSLVGCLLWGCTESDTTDAT